MNLAKRLQSLSLGLLLMTQLGCGADDDAGHKLWSAGSSGPFKRASYNNMYVSEPNRNSRFGLIFFQVDKAVLTAGDEESLVTKSVAQCRVDFSNAYRSGRILAHDMERKLKDKWSSSTPGAPFVPFQPEWIVVVVHTPGNATLPGQQIASPSSTFAELVFPVAYVFNSRDVFDAGLSCDVVVQNGFRCESPIVIDQHAAIPAYEYQYRVIDRFLDEVGR